MHVRSPREKKRFSQHGGFLHRALGIVVPVALGALLTFAGSAAAAGADPAPLALTAVGQSGSYFDITMNPGETRQLQVARINPGATSVTAHSYAGSVFTIVNGGFGATGSGAAATGATRWVTYPDEVFPLAATTTDTKTFTVTVPAGTAPGQYISSIVIQNDAASPGQGPVALSRVVRQAVAISIYVPGALTPHYTLGTVGHSVVAGNSVVSVALNNDGNQHVKPRGTITITDAAQKIVSRADVALGTVYAGTTTTVAVTLSGTLLPGQYTATLTLTDPVSQATASATNAPFTVEAPAGDGPPDIVKIITDIIDAIVAPDPPKPVATPTPEPSPEPSAIDPAPTPEPVTSAPVPTSTPTPTPAPALTPLGEEPPASATMTFTCTVGDALASCLAEAQGLKLKPGSAVTMTAYSTPQVILRETVSAGGTWAGKVHLPTNLEPGPHSLVLEYTAADGKAGTIAGALILDSSLNVQNLAAPAAVAVFNADTAAALARAAEAGAPIYDVAAHPVTTAAVAVAGVSLLGIVGVGGGGAPSGGGSSGGGSGGGNKGGGDKGGDGPEGGELSHIRNRKLEIVAQGKGPWGDRSRTWRAPGTSTIDAISRTLPATLAAHSGILQRFLVDGVWARAIFGSASLLLLLLGPVLVLVDFFFIGWNGLLPAWPILVTLIVLGVLDSLTGLLSFFTITTIAIASGSIHSLPDVRTLLGLVIVLATLPLVNQGLRPLRRKLVTRRDLLERIFDYVVPPIFLGFAAASMLKAINGLSGLELITPEDMVMARWAVGIALVVRLAVEDIAAISYPERSLTVQAVGLGQTTKTAGIVAATVGIAIFMFVTSAYFGFETVTFIAAAFFATPVVLRIWQDHLPNINRLYFWLPRGFVKYVVLLVVGIFLAKLVLGATPTAESIATGFIILMIPTLLVGVLEILGRKGQSFPKAWLPLATTGGLFILGAGVVLGFIVLG